MSEYVQIVKAYVNNVEEYRVYINYTLSRTFGTYEEAEIYAKRFME
jgi:hypothetical protein